MRSDTHKVLHPIAGRPMLMHLLATVEAMGAGRSVVVVGKGREQLEKALGGHGIATALQAEQKAPAMLCKWLRRHSVAQTGRF